MAAFLDPALDQFLLGALRIVLGQNPVVYKKLVSFHGGESLTLQIPESDKSDETIEEITLTHETPQGFGLAQNVPEPSLQR